MRNFEVKNLSVPLFRLIIASSQKIIQLLKEHAEVKKIGSIVTLNFEDLLKIDIDCSFDKDLSIEKVHDLTSKIEQNIRSHFKNSVITIHPEPY